MLLLLVRYVPAHVQVFSNIRLCNRRSALDAGVYETARSDQACRDDGSVVRLHAEDGCQLTGKPPRAKYAQTGGPTYAYLNVALCRGAASGAARSGRAQEGSALVRPHAGLGKGTGGRCLRPTGRQP